MHFNKRNNSGSSESLLPTASSTYVSPPSSSLWSSSSSSSSSPKTSHGVRLGLWCFLLVAVVLMAQQQPCEGRYLETRSNGDDLDKLRELMLQILESSDDQGTDNTMSGQRADWLNKLGAAGIESRKFAAPHGVYDNGRYY